MKKGIYLLVVVVVALIIGFMIFQSTKSKSPENSAQDNSTNNSTSTSSADVVNEGSIAILFYGKDCPHCKNVEKWLDENKVSEKVKYDLLEVWYNENNKKLLSEKAKICNKNDSEVGVPFLFDIANNKCFTGEVEVVDFFKSKLK